MTTAAAPSSHVSALEIERRAHEPSMEEILASIRKIIADDDALPITKPAPDLRSSFAPGRPFEANVTQFAPRIPPQARDHAPVAEGDLADTTPAESVAPAIRMLEDAELASFAEIASQLSAHDFTAASAEQAHDSGSAPVTSQTVEFQMTPRTDRSSAHISDEPAVMISAEAGDSVASAFRALSASVQMTNSETIERHVRELLRPMLKQWLDDNLPVMVERMVRAEIERVARGIR